MHNQMAAVQVPHFSCDETGAYPSLSGMLPLHLPCHVQETDTVCCPRDLLSTGERKDYVSALQCLLTTPSKSDPSLVPGARNRYDDFAAVHINQTLTIHGTVSPLSTLVNLEMPPEEIERLMEIPGELLEMASLLNMGLRTSPEERMWIPRLRAIMELVHSCDQHECVSCLRWQ